MSRLQDIVRLAPKLGEIFLRNDIMVAVTNDKQYLFYSPGVKLDARVTNGMPFLEYDLFGTMRETKSASTQISPPEYGAPFRAVGAPILDEHGNMIGGVGFGLSLQCPDSIVQSVTTFSQVLAGLTQNQSGDTSLMHQMLNNVCTACGHYGNSSCAVCPVELQRQEEVLYKARMIQLFNVSAAVKSKMMAQGTESR